MTVTTQSQRRGDLFGSRSFTKDDLLAVPEFKEALDDYAEYVRRYQWDVMTAVRKDGSPRIAGSGSDQHQIPGGSSGAVGQDVSNRSGTYR